MLYKAIYNAQKHFTEAEACNVVSQIMDALAHMHEQHVMHCDLKPENVLCTRDPALGGHFDIKVTDFGLSKPVFRESVGDSSKVSFPGSPLYKAPEMLAKVPFTYTADNWSVGIIMFELLCGKPPFGENMKLDDFIKYVKGFRGFGVNCSVSTEQSIRIEKQLLEASVSLEAQDLLAKLLDPDAACRITASDALHHPWLKDTASKSPLALKRVASDLRENNAKITAQLGGFPAADVVSLGRGGDGAKSDLMVLFSKPKFTLVEVEAVLALNGDAVVQARDDKGNTVLHYLARLAAKDGHTENMDQTASHPVAYASFTECGKESIQLLLDHGADVNAKGWSMSTPLIYATKAGHAPTMTLILRNGASVDEVDASNCTALHYAAWLGSVECVQLLMDHAADTSIETKRGENPLALAIAHDRPEIVNLLGGLPSAAGVTRRVARARNVACGM